MSTAVNIDFSKFNGPVYAGRARGESARKQVKLDQIDDGADVVEIIVPDGTYTVTSSFFLGMFGPSVIRAGSRDAFVKRFHFKTPSFLQNDFEEYISYALETRKLFS
ncbi:MAG: hypothetical protein COY49_10315 [Comamonadaceae bacterium CG_4_10_14_0_8_um_filter_57_29]|nr:MAG: hypothetical protein COY49_10315 [Comamonadaceae bacterium CG_4_10_14_0_8_um_filter_57_29]